jgi:hypothetical protein
MYFVKKEMKNSLFAIIMTGFLLVSCSSPKVEVQSTTENEVEPVQSITAEPTYEDIAKEMIRNTELITGNNIDASVLDKTYQDQIVANAKSYCEATYTAEGAKQLNAFVNSVEKMFHVFNAMNFCEDQRFFTVNYNETDGSMNTEYFTSKVDLGNELSKTFPKFKNAM